MNLSKAKVRNSIGQLHRGLLASAFRIGGLTKMYNKGIGRDLRRGYRQKGYCCIQCLLRLSKSCISDPSCIKLFKDLTLY